jgi:hypothetical protein
MNTTPLKSIIPPQHMYYAKYKVRIQLDVEPMANSSIGSFNNHNAALQSISPFISFLISAYVLNSRMVNNHLFIVSA